MTRRLRGQGGSAAVELTIVTPLLLLFLFLVVAAGRVGQARSDVHGAASQAARAASLREPGLAAADARATAERALQSRGPSCQRVSVAVDTTRHRPGGSVSVSVACAVSLTDLVGLGVPGTRVVRASATEVIDQHRGVP